MSNQQIASQTALRAVRTAEAMAGHTVSQHYSPGGFRLLATPPKGHKRNRQTSKARARWMGLCRFFGQPLIGGDYQLGL